MGKYAINDERINGDGQRRNATREEESERHRNPLFGGIGILQVIVLKREMLAERLDMI